MIRILFGLLILLLLTMSPEGRTNKTTPPIKNHDTLILAALINSECGICDELEMYLVGSTVINRANHHRFPNTITEVITQKRQYYGFGTKHFVPTEKTLEISKNLLLGLGLYEEVLYFWSPKATNKRFINAMEDRVLYRCKYHKYAR